MVIFRTRTFKYIKYLYTYFTKYRNKAKQHWPFMLNTFKLLFDKWKQLLCSTTAVPRCPGSVKFFLQEEIGVANIGVICQLKFTNKASSTQRTNVACIRLERKAQSTLTSMLQYTNRILIRENNQPANYSNVSCVKVSQLSLFRQEEKNIPKRCIQQFARACKRFCSKSYEMLCGKI